MMKGSDVFTYARDLQEYFTSIGSINSFMFLDEIMINNIYLYTFMASTIV